MVMVGGFYAAYSIVLARASVYYELSALREYEDNIGDVHDRTW